MKFIEKHPMIMIITGIIGISLSAILVRLSNAPSAVTAAYRLIWTVFLMTPVTIGKRSVRAELFHCGWRTAVLSFVSGVFLAIHFVFWFESLQFTSVASSTTIVCTEMVWVSLGFCLFMGGRISRSAVSAMAVTLFGSVLIAFADSGAGNSSLYGDLLALIAAVAVAVYTLIGRAVRMEASTSVYTYLVYAACAAVLTVVCLVSGYSLWPGDGSALLVGFLLAVFSTILGHSIFSWCLKFFSPSFVSASKLCEPVAAAIMAWILFGEVPGILQVVGGILVISGVIVYSRIEVRESISGKQLTEEK